MACDKIPLHVIGGNLSINQRLVPGRCQAITWTTNDPVHWSIHASPGARPTNGIFDRIRNRSKFALFWFEICSTDHNELLHRSRQCYCRDISKISLSAAEYVMKKSVTKFHWISNSIEISLVVRAPGPNVLWLSSIRHIRTEAVVIYCKHSDERNREPWNIPVSLIDKAWKFE